MDPRIRERAERLALDLTLIDTHIDVPYRLRQRWEDVGLATEHGQFDYPRARAGGLDVAFMSIYVPASMQQTGGARKLADELINEVRALVDRHPDRFTIGTSVDEVRRSVGGERIVLALGMENGAPLEGDLEALSHFFERGVRYITLTHSKSNSICDSSYDTERPWGGLSPFGRRVVAEMNRLGMLVDVSHISDEAFEQVLEVSVAPVIASHSSARHFTPGWERNMDDEMIRRLAAAGGVIQINFGSSFLDDRYRRSADARRKDINDWLEAHGIEPDSDAARRERERMERERPIPVADVATVADHIDHVVRLVGIDHVGLGSDFDGVGDSLPTGLKDVSAYPNLIAQLLARGYSEADIEKVASGNVLRVWAEVERIAQDLSAAE